MLVPLSVRGPILVLAAPLLGGCASMIAGSAAETLSAAILNQNDPQIVADGAPAYLLLMDGFIQQSPESTDLLVAGAQLFSAYGALFVEDEERAVAMTAKARSYGERALCIAHEPACDFSALSFDGYQDALARVNGRDIGPLYAYAVGWLANLQAASSEWSTVADLPRVEAALERIRELDDTYEGGAVHVYLGILNSLRPPALGGKPEVARAHFERAIELSSGQDLSAKVEFARNYARLTYDQELHDRLLNEVLEARADVPNRTLFNVLAKRQAQDLLESGEDYF